MPNNIVMLTRDEMEFAARKSSNLHDSLRRKGIKDGHGARAAEMTREVEAGGAAAELAVARYFNVPWHGHNTSGGGKQPDVGTRTQVRSSNKPRRSHSLIIRERDLEKYGNVPFILVIQKGDRFELKGWLMSHEAKEVGKWWDGGDHHRPPAYFVHESKLHPIETLRNL